MTAMIQGCSESPVNVEVNVREDDDSERIEHERFCSDHTGTGEPESVHCENWGKSCQGICRSR